MKNYSTHFKCHVMFENEQMKKEESLPSGRGEGGVDCHKYSSQNMDEEASTSG